MAGWLVGRSINPRKIHSNWFRMYGIPFFYFKRFFLNLFLYFFFLFALTICLWVSKEVKTTFCFDIAKHRHSSRSQSLGSLLQSEQRIGLVRFGRVLMPYSWILKYATKCGLPEEMVTNERKKYEFGIIIFAMNIPTPFLLNYQSISIIVASPGKKSSELVDLYENIVRKIPTKLGRLKMRNLGGWERC